MSALEYITDHVIFKLHYNQIYQLKTTIAWHLKKFKAQSFFTNGVRGFISDFAVIIAILTMTGVDVWANVSKI